jgi:hypothetical protein
MVLFVRVARLTKQPFVTAEDCAQFGGTTFSELPLQPTAKLVGYGIEKLHEAVPGLFRLRVHLRPLRAGYSFLDLLSGQRLQVQFDRYDRVVEKRIQDA